MSSNLNRYDYCEILIDIVKKEIEETPEDRTQFTFDPEVLNENFEAAMDQIDYFVFEPDGTGDAMVDGLWRAINNHSIAKFSDEDMLKFVELNIQRLTAFKEGIEKKLANGPKVY
jgi:hypothetical protein